MKNSLLKVAIIDIGWKELDKDIIKGALGGSETWLIRTAEELHSQWCDVTVYCNTKEEFKPDRCNVRYVPLNTLLDFTFPNHPYYDFIILNRGLYVGDKLLIPLIKQCNLTDCVFIQMHDLSFIHNDVIVENEQLKDTGITDDIVQGIIVLNEWHKKNTLSQYSCLDPSKIYCIPNGVDDKFIKPQREKDHRVLWSSCENRGLDILVDDIAPRVRLYIPDFGIDVATYGKQTNDFDVNYLGHLTKEELYEEMSKHACWFYPGVFAETFCITLLENIQQGAYPITPFTYGMSDTIGENNKQMIGMKYNFRDNYKEACWEAVEKIVDAINHYDRYKEQVKSLQQYIKQYKWSETAKKYLDLYEEVSGKYDYESIFLVMTAHTDFFKNALKAVRDTWAKDLIEDKYPRHKFLVYTSCDEQHPEPCLDGDVLYVKTGDELYDTYEKTKATYKLLDDLHITYKRIYRTNTSTYINVLNTINSLRVDGNNIAGESMHYFINYFNTKTGEFLKQDFCTWIIVGVFYGMSHDMIHKIFFSPFTTDDFYPRDADDVIQTRILDRLEIPHRRIKVNPLLPQTEYPRYKCCDLEDYEQFNAPHHLHLCYYDDPASLVQHNVTQLRTLYEKDERITRGHELEHMYELDRGIREIRGW